MKNYSLFFFLLLCALVSSCKDNNNSGAEHDIQVYHQAIRFGDMGTAIHSMHSLLARDTTQFKYYDTLGVLYFQSNNYPQAIQAAQNVLERDTNNLKMVEISARAYQAIGQFDMAVPFFVRVAKLDNNPEALYQVGVCQFYMQQFDAAEQSVNKVIEDPKAKDMELVIGFNNNSRQQQVPLLAAAYNMLGSIKYQQGNSSAARENFGRAIALYPDFTLPKENLEKLKK
ncbi:MAG: tetratricopeptide repeat protein [Bacteroidia bacterium]